MFLRVRQQGSGTREEQWSGGTGGERFADKAWFKRWLPLYELLLQYGHGFEMFLPQEDIPRHGSFLHFAKATSLIVAALLREYTRIFFFVLPPKFPLIGGMFARAICKKTVVFIVMRDGNDGRNLHFQGQGSFAPVADGRQGSHPCGQSSLAHRKYKYPRAISNLQRWMQYGQILQKIMEVSIGGFPFLISQGGVLFWVIIFGGGMLDGVLGESSINLLQCWEGSIIFTDRKMEKSDECESGSINGAPRVVIGYYNLRGKAQVCRLLLEYLGVEYEDRLYSLAEWQKASSDPSLHFAFPALPFLQQGPFVVTESVPMCCYIINRFGEQELLGRTLGDRGVIEMYFWTIPYMETVISINCQQKSAEELRRFKQEQWDRNVYPRMVKLEEAAHEKGQWFLGYLTVIDFSIYELVRYMDCIFDGQTSSLPKLKDIQRRVQELPAIKNYEQSTRAITEWCPTKLLEALKAMTEGKEKAVESKDKSATAK